MSKLFRARKLLQTKLYHRAEEMGLLKENKKNNNIIKLVG
jgi:hypothetical protein